MTNEQLISVYAITFVYSLLLNWKTCIKKENGKAVVYFFFNSIWTKTLYSSWWRSYMTQSMMNVFVQFASSRDRWTFDSSSIKL